MTSSADFNPPAGIACQLAPGLRRILAPNPSAMTFRGTNTYLLGTREIAVIDPGPAHQGHLAAILNATNQQRVTHIIVTHTHLDHSPLAAPLAKATGAPVLAFGGATAGRSKVMTALAANGFASGGEGVDTTFIPDVRLVDGDRVSSDDWSLEVIHTPGHLGNHICLAWGTDCFTGDHIMGWASSLVSPPDGDLTDFMASCTRLRARDWHKFYPGHGDVIDAPQDRLSWLMAHRTSREASILEVLREGPTTAAEITARVYADTPRAMHPAAARNVLAHLIDLMGQSEVSPQGSLSATTEFKLNGSIV